MGDEYLYMHLKMIDLLPVLYNLFLLRFVMDKILSNSSSAIAQTQSITYSIVLPFLALDLRVWIRSVKSGNSTYF